MRRQAMLVKMDGERVRAMRAERGMNLAEFAELSGEAPRTLWSLEQGKTVQLTTGRKVAGSLGVDIRCIGRGVVHPRR